MASKAHKAGAVRWSQNRGRNGWDVGTEVADTMSAESVNIMLERGTLGRKRRGSATQSFTGDAFTGYNAAYRFVPSAGETSANVFAVSTDATQKIVRISGGTSAVDLTLPGTITSIDSFATLNNKLYFGGNWDANRLAVYDPTLSTTAVRWAGLVVPAAPTVANQGSGTYSATLRYYRVQWRVKSGSTIQRQSLLGTAQSFTPSGTGQYARVTKPTASAEGETHWVVYGAADVNGAAGVYYELSEIAVGTTTYDDSTEPDDYDANDPAPDEGAFTPFPAVRFLISTGERLIGFGAPETAAGDSVLPRAGRVYFTPVLDTTDTDDDERLSNTTDISGWIDVGRYAGGEDRAIMGPLDASVLVYQSRGVYLLVPTGDANAPLRRVTLSPELGAVSQQSTFLGEDEIGRPCIYWLDPVHGPYRYGGSGLQWLGYDVQDLWQTVNLAATTRVAAGVYDSELRACIFWLATGASNTLNEAIVFFVREGQPTSIEGVRGGWTRWFVDGAASTFRCIALLPETIGATMSRTLRPYVGNASALTRWNDDSATQDVSTSFQAYVTSKTFTPAGLQRRVQLMASYLQASAHSGVTITETFTRNFGDETARTATVTLTATGSQTRIIKRFEAGEVTDASTFSLQLGDSAAANTAGWTLDEWTGMLEPLEEL